MLDFFQGLAAIENIQTASSKSKSSNLNNNNYTNKPFAIFGDEIQLIQTLKDAHQKILKNNLNTSNNQNNNLSPENNFKRKNIKIEQSKDWDEFFFERQSFDLFSGQTFIYAQIEQQKLTKLHIDHLKTIHEIGLKNYFLCLPAIDKTVREAPWLKAFEKLHTCIELPKLNYQPQFFKEWLIYTAKNYQLNFSPDALNLLMSHTHNHLIQAQQVLQQLYHRYVLNDLNIKNNIEINLETLKPYLQQHSQYEFSDILQAMWQGQTQRMLKACEHIMQTETPHLLIWLINEDLLKISQLLEYKTRQEAINYKALNIWGDKQKAYSHALRSITRRDLNQYWQSVLMLERASKGIDNWHQNIWQPMLVLLTKISKSFV